MIFGARFRPCNGSSRSSLPAVGISVPRGLPLKHPSARNLRPLRYRESRRACHSMARRYVLSGIPCSPNGTLPYFRSLVCTHRASRRATIHNRVRSRYKSRTDCSSINLMMKSDKSRTSITWIGVLGLSGVIISPPRLTRMGQ